MSDIESSALQPQARRSPSSKGHTSDFQNAHKCAHLVWHAGRRPSFSRLDVRPSVSRDRRCAYETVARERDSTAGGLILR